MNKLIEVTLSLLFSLIIYSMTATPADARWCKGKGTLPPPFDVVKAEAEQGNAIAQYMLGRTYQASTTLIPLDGDKDDEIAFKWFQRSANQGYMEAQRQLSYLYREKGNVDEAYFWLSFTGHQVNLNRLSKSLSADRIDAVNERVRKWKPTYEKEPELTPELREIKAKAEDGDVYAQMELANAFASIPHKDPCIESERITDPIYRNRFENRKWLRKAALQGNPLAQYFLANTYYSHRDFETGTQWCREAAIRGQKHCQGMLGLFMIGPNSNQTTNFIQNFEEALFWDLIGGYRDTDPNRLRIRQEKIEKHLTPGQVRKVEHLVEEWWKNPTSLKQIVEENFMK